MFCVINHNVRASRQSHPDETTPKPTPTDREALTDARARVEMLERERGDLIRRAEAAEMTAQQATATAAALALKMKEVEGVGAATTETPRQAHAGGHETGAERGQRAGVRRDSRETSVWAG